MIIGARSRLALVYNCAFGMTKLKREDVRFPENARVSMGAFEDDFMLANRKRYKDPFGLLE